MQFLSLTWADLEKEAYTLSQKIKAGGNSVDLIVAVARGGLTLAQLLTDFLALPITSFTVSSYRDLQQQKNPQITFKIGNKLHNRKILLVDDISDTGKTFVHGISYLRELGAQEIVTASLLVKPQTSYLPDYFVETTDKWVIFPYEIRETTESLVARFFQEGLDNKAIRAKFRELKLSEYFLPELLP